MADPARKGPISLDTLSTAARVINASPAWPAVRNAVDYLRSGLGDSGTPSYQNAVRDVHEFAELLRASSGAIADALVCAAMLTRVMPPSPRGNPLRRALMTLSEAYRFEIRDAEFIAATLRRVRQDLARALGIVAHMPVSLAASSVERWVDQLRAALNTVVTQPRAAPEPDPAAFANGLRVRMLAFLTGTVPPDPSVAELMAYVARLPTAPYLRWDLAAMTIAEWSDVALDAALPRKRGDVRPPYWLVTDALQALGFAINRPSELAAWAIASGSYPPAANFDLNSNRSTAARGALVLVRGGKSSFTMGWRPERDVATLMMMPADLEHALERLPTITVPPMYPPVTAVAFEIEDSEVTVVRAKEWSNRLAAQGFGSLRFGGFTADSQSMIAQPWGVVHGAPRGAADLYWRIVGGDPPAPAR
jgi:hypothetical protein